jgi:hypothetical protein
VQNFYDFTKTNFVRYVYINEGAGRLSPQPKFLPFMPTYTHPWTDSELYKGTSDSKEGFTPCEPKMVRYKYQGSSVIYLNKLRNQEFKNYDEASKEFFNRAIFIDEVRVKNEA